MDISNFISGQVKAFMDQVDETRERFCEMMLQDGERGILETQNLREGTITFELTNKVPYGVIHVVDI